MWKNSLIMGLRKLIAIVLIINLITVAVGQEINMQPVETVSETGPSMELSPVDKISDASVDPDSGMGLSKNIESVTGDNQRNGQLYRLPAIGDRGAPATSISHTQSSESVVKRKLLPPPEILPDTADNLQKELSVEEPYRIGKIEKRILLITGAILVTGGLVFLLVKLKGKGENTTEDAGFPEPPRPPEY